MFSLLWSLSRQTVKGINSLLKFTYIISCLIHYWCHVNLCLSFFIISESFMLDMPPGQTFCCFISYIQSCVSDTKKTPWAMNDYASRVVTPSPYPPFPPAHTHTPHPTCSHNTEGGLHKNKLRSWALIISSVARCVFCVMKHLERHKNRLVMLYNNVTWTLGVGAF